MDRRYHRRREDVRGLGTSSALADDREHEQEVRIHGDPEDQHRDWEHRAGGIEIDPPFPPRVYRHRL